VIVGDEGDWAVVGGTGKFELAQGICSYKKIKTIEGGMIHELRIRVVCLSFPKQAVRQIHSHVYHFIKHEFIILYL
jgi:hypothetical protein